MQSSRFTPEVVIGIDFGMTCTGVAYSWGPEWPEPRTIQHWPGKLGHEVRNKVNTAIAYDRKTGHPVAWGFLIDHESPDIEVQELFKLYLDYSHEDDLRDGVTVQAARTWFKDYLCCLHSAIARSFDDSMPRWRLKNIEFNFSVPTTWKDPAMVAEMEAIIKSTGFGEQPNSRVQVTLTEAEAAAVCVSKQHLEKGDVYVVCDAGGGTTDVNVLKITTAAGGQTILEPLSWVEGRAVGSTLIDFKMQRIICKRLESIRHSLPVEPSWLAEKMISDRFETYKCSFGSDTYKALDLVIPIPGLPAGIDLPHAGINDSKMIILRSDLQQLFDEQLQKIFELIDTQLQRLMTTHPRESVAFVALSGGLGSSPYVKEKFRKRYHAGGTGLQNAASMNVIAATEPQLAVTHGLVIDRVQSLKNLGGVFQERCCRHSYGVVVRAVYDPVAHMGEDIAVDARDKKKWAERQIHWLIKQGERISVDRGVSNRYRLKINLGKEEMPWRTQIVMSTLPSNHLPRSLKNASGVAVVCTVESVLNMRDLKLKNRHWYNFGPQYYRADFDVRAVVGAADLKFQLWGDNGTRLSRDHDSIEVVWNTPQNQIRPTTVIGDDDGAMYQNTASRS